MQITLLVTLVLHFLSGVFWAGSTFALARTVAATADQLFFPQMGAAAVAVITGGVLWYLLHPSGFSTMEQVLALGALGAIVAAGAQGALCGRALRQLARNGEKDSQPRVQVVLGHRIAAALLALTVICMAAARYA
jgi:F0F1-type ATP synthase membrane subunit c/vacuolar-type H+-ATPase subunit K